MKIIFAALFVVLLCGCTNLVDKEVVLDSSVQGMKVTAGVDTATGTPLPTVAFGWGSNLLITVPVDKTGTLEFEKNSGSFFGSAFGLEVKDSVKVRITNKESMIKVTTTTGKDKEVITEVGKGSISVNVKDNNVITVP